jgi:hypothetical protein
MPARSALVIAILLGCAHAAAAGTGDWNQYIEKPGATYTPIAKQAQAAKPASDKAAKKAVATQPKPTPKAKASKAPVKARRKAR